MLYPSPNMIDTWLGVRSHHRPDESHRASRVRRNRKRVLDHMDEFNVSLHDSAAKRALSHAKMQPWMFKTRAPALRTSPSIHDDDMHNLLAYLETLK